MVELDLAPKIKDRAIGDGTLISVLTSDDTLKLLRKLTRYPDALVDDVSLVPLSARFGGTRTTEEIKSGDLYHIHHRLICMTAALDILYPAVDIEDSFLRQTWLHSDKILVEGDIDVRFRTVFSQFHNAENVLASVEDGINALIELERVYGDKLNISRDVMHTLCEALKKNFSDLSYLEAASERAGQWFLSDIDLEGRPTLNTATQSVLYQGNRPARPKVIEEPKVRIQAPGKKNIHLQPIYFRLPPGYSSYPEGVDLVEKIDRVPAGRPDRRGLMG